MLNPDLRPWNLFNKQNQPVMGISGNVLVGEKEWYNSFMPCFFESRDINLAKKLKDEIDINNSDPSLLVKTEAYREYYEVLRKYEDEREMFRMASGLKERVNHYFNVVERSLFSVWEQSIDDVSLLGFVLAGLNLMQEHMDPIETFTTRKRSVLLKAPGEKLRCLNDLSVLDKTPSSEVAYIPMVVLTQKGIENDNLKRVKKYYSNLFDVNLDVLLESAEYSDNLYQYTSYMSTGLAQKLIDKTADKLHGVDKLTDTERITFFIQEINGIMTWSKNLLLHKSAKERRYDSTNNILSLVKQTKFVSSHKEISAMLQPVTISGSEKQALLIYTLNRVREIDQNMFGEIKYKAVKYYNLVKK
ncbi:hypothetical protein A2572_02305 [Candidatus Collierbacteria bacterium RIFOXYD1_FULL_40_9]|uniref:Uncharacterized protein n=1 Tax=Candidatus Collierbacteria bacterium RIFOXYD1_FULL_40_9 TaxID=1817731 RepID=A0A1F5FNX6_9BACT|nr:MAG: hypothetical protein A2572_02305 [Candidatus Collierbacteria bacterium RIFOXYD1_FULL_40_9]